MNNTAQAEAQEGYATTAIALHFPPEMLREADGEKMKFRYQIYRVGDAGQIDGYRPEGHDVLFPLLCLMLSGPQVLELMHRFIDQSQADSFGETYGFIAPKPEPGAKTGLAAPALPGLMKPNPPDDELGPGGSGGPVYDGGVPGHHCGYGTALLWAA